MFIFNIIKVLCNFKIFIFNMYLYIFKCLNHFGRVIFFAASKLIIQICSSKSETIVYAYFSEFIDGFNSL